MLIGGIYTVFTYSEEQLRYVIVRTGILIHTVFAGSDYLILL